MHDPRIGRFFAIDPIAGEFPWNSPYAFSENVVIDHVELEGLEKAKPLDFYNPATYRTAGQADLESVKPKKPSVSNSSTVGTTALANTIATHKSEKGFVHGLADGIQPGLSDLKPAAILGVSGPYETVKGWVMLSIDDPFGYKRVAAMGKGLWSLTIWGMIADYNAAETNYDRGLLVGRWTKSGAESAGGIIASVRMGLKPPSPASTLSTETSASSLARSWQGRGAYPGIDTWRNITLKKGTEIVGGLPGQSEYYTTLSGLNRSGLSKTNLSQGLQIRPHPEFGYRPSVGVYRVNQPTNAAFGTTYANPQYGTGGLPQIFLPDYSGLELIKTLPLNK